jgi:adenylate cyclase
MKNNNAKLFEEIFSEEIISNESFRSKILAGIIAFLILIVFLISIMFENWFKNTSQFSIIIKFTLIILFLIFIRAVVISRAAKRWNRFGIKTFIVIRYINAFIEISVPTIVLFIYSFDLPSVYPIFTPIALLYFIIILLSALELDFKLCVFTGTLAAIQYLLLAYYLSSKPSPDEMIKVNSFLPIYLGNAALFFISGHTAGLITNQIKKGLLRHYSEQSKRTEIEKLFGQQISKEVVDELVENQYQVTSRTRFVAIMFLDIRNFSIFAQNKSPEEIITYQNEIFSFIIEIINKNKGIVNQIVGDGIMAIFGAPLQHENDCELAVNAATEIQRELDKRNKEKLIPFTKIGIGIHAGDVVTGNVGTSERKQYSVTGQAVIIAARIEQLNKDLNSSLLISKVVYDKISVDHFNPVKHNNLSIKGYPTPIDIYQLA